MTMMKDNNAAFLASMQHILLRFSRSSIDGDDTLKLLIAPTID